jgi:hypothetical protein
MSPAIANIFKKDTLSNNCSIAALILMPPLHKMKTLLLKYKLELAGLVTGAVAGWSYWYFVGCSSGQCPITSKPLNSTLYGAILGMLLFSIFKKDKKQQV